MTTITLKPGIYNLAPCQICEDDALMVCLDPVTAAADIDDESVFVPLAPPVDAVSTEGCPDGVVVVRVAMAEDMAEAASEEPFSIQTPFGPLTVARHYSIMPAEAFSRNPVPGEQYGLNWLCFELTGEQEVSVEGSTIRIGGMEIDPTALGDVYVSTHTLDGVVRDWGDIVATGRAREAIETRHVARCGTPLNRILQDMPCSMDDGVLYIATFSAEQLTEIEWLGTPEANAFAQAMRDQMAAGRNHICFSPAIA